MGTQDVPGTPRSQWNLKVGKAMDPLLVHVIDRLPAGLSALGVFLVDTALLRLTK